MTRRRFLSFAKGAFALGAAGAAYPFLEAKMCRVTHRTITLPNLPGTFDGLRIAALSDVHLGRFVPQFYVKHVVGLANALRPDLVVLGGDYAYHGPHFLAPALGILGQLNAPLGRFGVLGNHDYYDGLHITREHMAKNGIRELTNDGVWLRRGTARIRLCGVDDLWEGRPAITRAVGNASMDDCVLLLSHNPDFLEHMGDERVSLAISGHTHGGQIRFPLFGAPILPSRYGQKYAYGLVQAPTTRVFVTCGVGTAAPPVRLLRPPEIACLTLCCERRPA
jgi:predicted MPP superfamily phosphohydrolase